MNKKRLSVVMAGAMLASSVAPVMAAEATTEATKVSANELGLLQEEIRDLVENNRFANEAANKNGSVDVRNQSIYSVVVNDIKQEKLVAGAKTEEWQKVFNGLRVGDTVKVYDRGSKEVDGKYYHFETTSKADVYDKTSLADLYRKLSKIKAAGGVIEDVNYNEFNEKELILKLNDAVTIPGLESEKTLSIKEGDKKIVFKKNSNFAGSHQGLDEFPVFNHVDGREEILTIWTKPEEFNGFVVNEELTPSTKPIPSKLFKEYKIVPGGYNFDISDLYDGLFLTDKGNEFFGTIKDNVASGRTVTVAIKDKKGSDKGILKNVGNYTEAKVIEAEETFKNSLQADKNGNYRFEVRFAAKDELKAETYTVTGKDKDELARLASWMLRPQARVDKFEGANRYETAALIAKEYAGLTRDSLNSKDKGKYNEIKGDVNIVLVNGNQLVDGLAAAPLAATKTNNVNGKKTSAPVLLTEADRLPRETKAYLREVLSNIALGDVPNVTINLVGGETVLTKDLERELKAIGFHGFKVERFGGDNREETSLEVAKEIGGTKAFVVGGEGEADAMSIASVAATQKTPIIVAKKGGISEDGIYEVRDKDVMIVGGKTVVTLAEENEIRTEAKSVNRIQGANRKATNAAVIEKYYRTTGNAGFANAVGSAQNVIVAKDGQNRPIDLVDALAAANMASEKKAPIVLATKALSKEQETVIKSHAKDAYGLFQVGGQVERPVMKKIAIMLNLTNRNTK